MSAPGYYAWTIYQGATNILPLTYYDPDGVTPINLTGYSARLQVREGYDSEEALIDLDSDGGGIVLGGAAGTVEITISEEESAELDFDRAVYDLELIDPAGDVDRLLSGPVTLSLEVTK